MKKVVAKIIFNLNTSYNQHITRFVLVIIVSKLTHSLTRYMYLGINVAVEIMKSSYLEQKYIKRG